MTGAQSFRLLDKSGVVAHHLAHGSRPASYHQDRFGARQRARRIQRVDEHRLPAQRMQHLGQVGLHSGSLARRQDHDS